jgi:sterol desaturase/sphingolipid hydroxylase (fatty acid hydroxylase superfamily)
MRSVIRYGLYPALMAGALAGLWAMLLAGVPLTLAPYLTLLLFGPLVVVAERVIPYRPAWTADGRDYVEDATFMAVVQVLVPLGLVWLATLGIRELLVANGLTFSLWPVAWPILAQLALKVVAGDFLRYWLHRLAHTWTPLWRLHQVHHHPGKLYSTNVFRFHPLEKSLQFLGDTLPFLVLGIGSEALAWYFVFYAISGLFQHCNADIRLGWLNYLVSGPEVHRWHHSRVIAESNNNYAHSFVVWDLVFGTYFRPKGREVGELGLIEADYPRGFARQMTAPFSYRPLSATGQKAAE